MACNTQRRMATAVTPTLHLKLAVDNIRKRVVQADGECVSRLLNL